jgi:hypothetical protein
MVHVHLEDIRAATGDRQFAFERGEEYPDPVPHRTSRRIAAINAARRGQSPIEVTCSHCGQPCVELILLGARGVYCCEGCQEEGDR